MKTTAKSKPQQPETAVSVKCGQGLEPSGQNLSFTGLHLGIEVEQSEFSIVLLPLKNAAFPWQEPGKTSSVSRRYL